MKTTLMTLQPIIKKLLFYTFTIIIGLHYYPDSLSANTATISIDGVIESSTENYYIIPLSGNEFIFKEITITGEGHTESCGDSCPPREKVGDATYVFEKDAGTQNGGTITWEIDSDTELKEYKFKVKSVSQQYKDCPPGTGVSAVLSGESREITIAVIKITVQGPDFSIEGEDSDNFEVTLEPSQSSATYDWRATWPDNVGNSPSSVVFEPMNGRVTKIKKARWFANPDSQWAKESDHVAKYKIFADATIHGVTFSSSPIEMGVVVNDSNARVVWDHYLGNETIATGQVGLYWRAISQEEFRRAEVNENSINYGGLTQNSQFYNIVKAHEMVHVDQINNRPPWSNMWDVDSLYNNGIAVIYTTTEDSLMYAIQQKITTWHEENMNAWNQLTCEREWQAFEAEYNISPYYRKMRKEDIEEAYGCSFLD